jgi:hypothetical protein
MLEVLAPFHQVLSGVIRINLERFHEVNNVIAFPLVAELHNL